MLALPKEVSILEHCLDKLKNLFLTRFKNSMGNAVPETIETPSILNSSAKGYTYNANEIELGLELHSGGAVHLKRLETLLNILGRMIKAYILLVRLDFASETKRENQNHRMWHETLEFRNKIDVLKHYAREKKMTNKWKLSEKTAILQEIKQDLANTGWINVMLGNSLNATDKIMNEMLSNEIRTNEEYRNLITRKQSELKTSMSTHLSKVMECRNKRKKKLDALLLCIQMIDNDVSTKATKLIMHVKVFGEEVFEFTKLKRKFDTRIAEYDQILSLKEAEEKRFQQESMLIFMLNRAARIIQKSWRKYILMKKKPKGRGRGRRNK